jgi:hypothetical protein
MACLPLAQRTTLGPAHVGGPASASPEEDASQGTSLARPLTARPDPAEATKHQVASRGFLTRQVVRRQPWVSTPSTWVTSRCQDKGRRGVTEPSFHFGDKGAAASAFPKASPKAFPLWEKKIRTDWRARTEVIAKPTCTS